TRSTGDAEAGRNWRRTEAADVIDHVVTSHSVGWAKPHPAMFERALALAGAPASEAFMVGDDLDVDVAGAGALGIRTVGKGPRGAGRDRARRRPDAVIASLRELPAALEPWIRAWASRARRGTRARSAPRPCPRSTAPAPSGGRPRPCAARGPDRPGARGSRARSRRAPARRRARRRRRARPRAAAGCRRR